jgi:phage gpG-like protein
MIRGEVINNTKLPAKGSFDSALHKTISKLTYKLLGMVKADFLSGQSLKRKSGRLSRSINAKFEDSGNTGVVGTTVSYAAQHEYGLAVTIPAHMRMMKQAWGRPVKSPRLVEVKSHTVKYPERSFLRAALKDLEPEIQPAIQKAVKDAIKI